MSAPSSRLPIARVRSSKASLLRAACSKASRLLAAKDRRDRMVLRMAQDATRVKSKAREERNKFARQKEYRRVRFHRFKGRREDVMEEETRSAYRGRLGRSIQTMAVWLEAQARVNSEEGTSRFVIVMEEDEMDDVPLSEFVVKTPEPTLIAVAFIAEGPALPGEVAVPATLVQGAAVFASPDSVGSPPVKGAGPPGMGAKPAVASGQSLITSFFGRG
jgi:hypothetical protein